MILNLVEDERLHAQAIIDPLALGDELEDDDEMLGLRAIDFDRKALAEGFDMGLEFLRAPAPGDARIAREEFGIQFVQVGNDFAGPAADKVGQTGLAVKRLIDPEINEILRLAILDQHPAVGNAVQHLFEQGDFRRIGLGPSRETCDELLAVR